MEWNPGSLVSAGKERFLLFAFGLRCRCAVLGAGFAGLSVAWHLLRVLHSSLFVILLLQISCAKCGTEKIKGKGLLGYLSLFPLR